MRRRRWLRAASALCVAVCMLFFGAVAAGFTESPSVHNGFGPAPKAHDAHTGVVLAARDRALLANR